jgi:hypothetical protein
MSDKSSWKRPADEIWSDNEEDKKKTKISPSPLPQSSSSDTSLSSDVHSESDDEEKPTYESDLQSASDSSASSDLTEWDSEVKLENKLENDIENSETVKIIDKIKKIKYTRSGDSIKIPNIYSSSNLEILSGGQLKFSKGRSANSETVKIDNSIIPKLKPHYEKMKHFKQPTGITQAQYKSPDEILTDNYHFEANELVYLSRKEIKDNTKIDLPGEEITNAIHYYFSQRIRTKLGLTDDEYNKKYTKFLDGSALLALSALVTKWVENYCGESTYKGYMENVQDEKAGKLSSIDEFIRVYDEKSSENEIEESDDSNSIDEINSHPHNTRLNNRIENSDGELTSDEETPDPVCIE